MDLIPSIPFSLVKDPVLELIEKKDSYLRISQGCREALGDTPLGQKLTRFYLEKSWEAHMEAEMYFNRMCSSRSLMGRLSQSCTQVFSKVSTAVRSPGFVRTGIQVFARSPLLMTGAIILGATAIGFGAYYLLNDSH